MSCFVLYSKSFIIKFDSNMKVYFSDFFEVSPHLIEQYGALNISLINDLPLFVDPFLLFNSSKPEYKKLHKEMLKYLCFGSFESLFSFY